MPFLIVNISQYILERLHKIFFFSIIVCYINILEVGEFQNLWIVNPNISSAALEQE